MKSKTKVVLRLLSNMIGNSDDKINFQHELSLTNRQAANLREAFANNSSSDIKVSKNQLSNTLQSEGFLGRRIDPLLKPGLPLMKNLMKPLAKSVLIPIGLSAASPAADSEIHKKILRSGTTTLIISNDETEDIIDIVKSLEDSGLLLKGVSETIQNETKEQKVGFLSMFSMLLCELGANLLGDVLASKGMNRAGEGYLRAGYGSSIKSKDF